MPVPRPRSPSGDGDDHGRDEDHDHGGHGDDHRDHGGAGDPEGPAVGLSTGRGAGRGWPAGLRPPSDRALSAAVVVLTAAAMAAAVVRSATDWTPTSDWALIDWQVRHIADPVPMLGPPSSVGFHHLGPMPYFALALFAHPLGASPHALSLATGVIAAVSLVAAVVFGHRRTGPLGGAIVAASGLWLAGSLPAGTLVDPWNPWLAMFPFFTLVVLVWSVLDDDWAALAPTALAASFVVQAHVGYVVPVAALGAVVASHLVRTALGHGREHPSARVVTATTLVIVGAWAAPAWQQVTARDANLAEVWSHATGDRPDTGLPANDNVGVLAAELGWPGPWLTGDEPASDLDRQVLPADRRRLAAPAIALVAAVGLARRSPSARRLCVVVGVAVATTALSVVLVEPGRMFSYVIRGAWPASASIAVALGVAALERLPRRWRPPLPERPSLTTNGAATAVFALVAATTAVGGVRTVVAAGDASVPTYAPLARTHEVACLDQLLPAIRQAVGDRPVHVELAEFWPTQSGPIVNELDRAGVPVSVSERFGRLLQTAGRDAAPHEALIVVAEESLADDWAQRPEVQELTRCALLSADESAELEQLRALTEPEPFDLLRQFELERLAVTAVVFVGEPAG